MSKPSSRISMRKITVALSDDDYNRIAWLRERVGAYTRSEVIRDALRLQCEILNGELSIVRSSI